MDFSLGKHLKVWNIFDRFTAIHILRFFLSKLWEFTSFKETACFFWLVKLSDIKLFLIFSHSPLNIPRIHAQPPLWFLLFVFSWLVWLEDYQFYWSPSRTSSFLYCFSLWFFCVFTASISTLLFIISFLPVFWVSFTFPILVSWDWIWDHWSENLSSFLLYTISAAIKIVSAGLVSSFNFWYVVFNFCSLQNTF